MVWHSLFSTRPDQGPHILPENGVPVLVCRDHEVPSVGIRQGNLWFYGWPVAVWRQEGPRWWRKLGPEPDGYLLPEDPLSVDTHLLIPGGPPPEGILSRRWPPSSKPDDPEDWL